MSVSWNEAEDALRMLADMVERDYVRREVHERSGEIWSATVEEWRKRCVSAEAERDKWKAHSEYNSHGWGKANAEWAKANAEAETWRQKCDELTVERDEWKAKAEARGANNLTWLYGNDEYLSSWAKFLAYLRGYATDESADEWLMAEHNDGLASENGVSGALVGANDGKVSTMPLKMPSEIKWQYMDDESYRQDADQREQAADADCESCDTREKLEADMREYFSHWMGGTSRTQAAIISWLDRQAAITAREWCHSIDGLLEENDELRVRVDELKAEVEAYRGEYEDMEFIVSIDEAMKFTTDPPGYVKKALADLQAERDELQRKLDIADRHEAESDQACDECKEHFDELLSDLTAERDELEEANEYHKLQYELACKDVDELEERLRVAKANPATLFASGRLDCKWYVEEVGRLRARLVELQSLISARYVKLPTDADGLPIRLGDTLYNERWKEGRRVYEIGFTDNDGTRVYDENGDWALADVCRHHKPRTLEGALHDLEGVLRDFSRKAVRIGMKGGVPSDVELYADEDAVAECADKIRGLFGGDEE